MGFSNLLMRDEVVISPLVKKKFKLVSEERPPQQPYLHLFPPLTLPFTISLSLTSKHDFNRSSLWLPPKSTRVGKLRRWGPETLDPEVAAFQWQSSARKVVGKLATFKSFCHAFWLESKPSSTHSWYDGPP